MSASFSQFVVDTLVYTGLLIVLVMALRAPVARWFGPQVAYALWALPLLRLFLPPLTLPASMAPAVQIAEPLFLAAQDVPPLPTYEPAAAVPTLAEILPAVWLGGAALFLAWRMQQYFAMRRSFLADARPVGDAGRVRLVETPAADLPLAFGIRDKVVALPTNFMAHHDRTARDLAIAHELAHHRGHDLLANLAAQLLLALHWFNPLAWIGWRAMRKDQEAACDARVVEGRARAERIAYAQVIAGFAAGDRLALSAPLACRMIGEKSIIHRLRTLTMSEVPAARRRLGVAVVVAGALALPLTASISYAHPEVLQLPEAPLPPVSAEAQQRVVIIDQPQASEALHSQEVSRTDGTTVILRTDRPLSPEQARVWVETAIASMPEPPVPPAPPTPPAPPSSESPAMARQSALRSMSEAEIAAEGAREDQAIARQAERSSARAQAMAGRAAAQAGRQAQLAEASALVALEHARAAIASAPMPEYARSEAMRELEREIAEMRERQEVSFVVPSAAGKDPLVATISRVGFRLNFAARNPAQIAQPTATDCPDEEVPAGRIV